MIIKKLSNLNRFNKTILMILNDFLIIYASFLIAIYLVNNFDYFVFYISHSTTVALFSLPVFIFIGLYKSQVRYMGYKAMLNIIYATLILSLIKYSVAAFSFYKGGGVFIDYVAKNEIYLRETIIFWLVLSFFIIGSRQIARWAINSIGISSIKREFIIYGAGSAGRSVVSALLTNNEVRILGYVDDDYNLHGIYVNNYPVLGGLGYLENIETKREKVSVLLAVPSMKISRRREVLRILEENSISVRSLPPLNEIATGMTNVQKIPFS